MELISKIVFKDFLEEAEKEKKELDESYKESRRQTEERAKLKKLQEELEPLLDYPISDK